MPSTSTAGEQSAAGPSPDGASSTGQPPRSEASAAVSDGACCEGSAHDTFGASDFPLNRPGTLIAALPAVLGFVPEKSLVLVTLEDGELGCVMRVDLVGRTRRLARPSRRGRRRQRTRRGRRGDRRRGRRRLPDVQRRSTASSPTTLAEALARAGRRAAGSLRRGSRGAGGRWHCADGCGGRGRRGPDGLADGRGRGARTVGGSTTGVANCRTVDRRRRPARAAALRALMAGVDARPVAAARRGCAQRRRARDGRGATAGRRAAPADARTGPTGVRTHRPAGARHVVRVGGGKDADHAEALWALLARSAARAVASGSLGAAGVLRLRPW